MDGNGLSVGELRGVCADTFASVGIDAQSREHLHSVKGLAPLNNPALSVVRLLLRCARQKQRRRSLEPVCPYRRREGPHSAAAANFGTGRP